MKRKGKDGGTNVVEHAPTDHTSLLAQLWARELRCSIETCRMITRAVRLPGSRSSFTATCCGIAAATSLPMTATIPDPLRQNETTRAGP